jgi:tRNA (guanine26-N2/guanine27-N2)-dimethyltransferase
MKETSFSMDFPTEIIEEGEVKIVVPKLRAFIKAPSDYAPSKAPVFYNPVMELNRDVAVLALQTYRKMVDREISVCEPLSGCGIRGIRFAAEVKGVKNVLINDINRKAFQLASCNVQINGLEQRVTVKNEDANCLLGCYGAPRKRFDAIDVDPFGSPVPYLDSALRALRNSGLLALTATDLASLCGVYPKACVRKYGGKPLRTEYCHELAVRLLAGCLATTAAKYDIATNVVFSHSTAHYIRVYAIMKYGARKTDEGMKSRGYVLHCFNCLHRETAEDLISVERSRKCSECGSKMSVAGPLWLGRIFDKKFCESMELEAKQNMFRLGEKTRKILALAKNEAEAPLTYYVVDKLCGALGSPVPPIKKVVEALNKHGFCSCLTHFHSMGIRTTASVTQMKGVLREVVTNEKR